MSGVVMLGVCGVTAALFLIALLPDRRASAVAAMALCGVGAVLDLAYLVAGAPGAELAIPIGLPGSGIVLALDGLSAFFLLLVFVTGCAAAGASLDHDPGASAPAFGPFVGGMALTLLAGDAFALVLGFEIMSLASFALVLTRDDDGESRSAALLYLGMAVLGAVVPRPRVRAARARRAGRRRRLQFAAMRAHPPEGWRAIVVLALVLVGAGSKAGFAPLHVWLPPAHAAAPSHVSALMSGAMTKVALYVLIRVLFDLCGPAQPLWWALPLLVHRARRVRCSARCGRTWRATSRSCWRARRSRMSG